MKLIALEEHFVTAGVANAWSRLDQENTDKSLKLFDVDSSLEDLSKARLRRMDDSSVDVQVLSPLHATLTLVLRLPLAAILINFKVSLHCPR